MKLKLGKILLIALAIILFVTAFTRANASTVIWESQGSPVPFTYGEKVFINHTNTAYGLIPNGTTFGGLTYSGITWDTDQSNTNEYYFEVYNYGSGRTNCRSVTATLSGFGFSYNVTKNNHTILFTGSECTMQDNVDRWQVRMYQASNDQESTNGAFLAVHKTDVASAQHIKVLEYQSVPQGPSIDPITIVYPTAGSSVNSPVTVTGVYNNENNFDQFGVDLYYNNEQGQLVNEFVWYSIPLEDDINIPFSYDLDTDPDMVYQIVLSLNGDGANDYFETDFHDFDTFGLTIPVTDFGVFGDLSHLDCDPSLITVDGFSSLGEYLACSIKSIFFDFVIGPIAEVPNTLNDLWQFIRNESIPLAYIFRTIEIYEGTDIPETYPLEIEPFQFIDAGSLNGYKIVFVDLADPDIDPATETLIERMTPNIKIGAYFLAFLSILSIALRKFL